MVAQLVFLEEYFKKTVPKVKEKKEKPVKKKRIRYLLPTYKKVYSLFQYDQDKYMVIWEKIRELAIKLDNPDIFFNSQAYKVLKLCYKYDECGELIPLGDSRHIYRLPSLYNIQALIFNYSKSPLELSSEDRNWVESGVFFTYENYDGGGGFGEIIGTNNLLIKQRVKLHISFLRYLRAGKSLKEALLLIKSQFLNELRCNNVRMR